MRRFVSVLFLALSLTVATAGLAAAHGPTGTLEIIDVEQTSPGVVRADAGVRYDDGDLAEEAAVTATFTSEDGTTVGPVELPNVSGGRYGADVELPAAGSWQVEVTSTGPTATASGTVDVTAVEEEEPPATEAPAKEDDPTEPSGVDEPTASADDADDDDDSSVLPIVLGGLLLLLIVAGAVVVLRRRTPQ